MKLSKFYRKLAPTKLRMLSLMLVLLAGASIAHAQEGSPDPAPNTEATPGPTIEIKVRAQKTTGTPDDFSDSASVCAGGVGSAAHTADVEVTTDPPTANYPIDVTLYGGDGVHKKASLSIAGTTDTNGQIHGALVSSDKLETVTLGAGGSLATVTFDWNVEWDDSKWVSDPETIAATNAETIQLIHHGEKVNGHAIHFNVKQITYLDSNGASQTTANATEIQPYAHFGADGVTGSDGKAEGTLTSNVSSVTEEILEFYDLSVFTKSPSPNLNGAPTAHPNLGQQGVNGTGIKYNYRSNGVCSIFYQPADLTTNPDIPLTGAGTMPTTDSKVAPGQHITFQLSINDIDQRKDANDPNATWADFSPDERFGVFHVSLTLTNATFAADEQFTPYTGDQATHAELNATAQGDGKFSFSGVHIVVGNNADPVTMEITAIDEEIIPAEELVAPDLNTKCRDETPFHTTFTWNKATEFPTKTTPDKQQYAEPILGILGEDTVGDEEEASSINVWYKCENDNTVQPNFAGIAVTEEFNQPEVPISNLQAVWVSPELIGLYPGYSDNDWRQHFWAKKDGKVDGAVGWQSSTFTISADNHFSDSHSGGLLGESEADSERFLSPLGKTATEITWDLPQIYKCKPTDKEIGAYTIHRKRLGAADGSGIYKIQKN